jgi:uncharacterized protein
MYVSRLAKDILVSLSRSRIGRGLIVTGARQTGKTTLLQREFVPDHEYYSFDEALVRESLARKPAAEWLARGKSYVFDEVQKAPDFLGTVKVILDAGPPEQRVILSGSAQLQLLSSVRETLAGRVVTRELYPLSIVELQSVARPLLIDMVNCSSSKQICALIDEASFSRTFTESMAKARSNWEYLLAWGGMPALLEIETDEHRWIWLQEYCQSYLQRDVTDLGRVSDLDDFVRLEKAAAKRAAMTLNYSDLARDADLSPITAKKYLRYLDLSYQAFLLEAVRGATDKRLVKAPRLHWMDIGVQRVLSGSRGGLTGAQFENAAVAEIYKLVRTLRIDVELSYLRTKDGREVDLLLLLPSKQYVAFEMKSSEKASPVDARHLRSLEEILDLPVLAGFVLYAGREIRRLGDKLFAIPAPALFAQSPA